MACRSKSLMQLNARFSFASGVRFVASLLSPSVCRGVAASQLSAWTKEQLGAAYVLTSFAQQVSRNPLVDRVTFRQWIETEPANRPPQGNARYAAEGPAPATVDPAATVGRWGGRTYLLDGYCRAVRFWKTRPFDALFKVYVPMPNQ